MRGFVYSGYLDKESLMRLIEEFFRDESAFHISQDIISYKPEEGLPSEIPHRGQVFSEKGEMRWEGDGKYLVVLLSESEFATGELAPLGGGWSVEEKKVYLTPPDAPHVSPKFKKYPTQVNNNVPKLVVHVYYRDSVATFVSPRRFEG